MSALALAPRVYESVQEERTLDDLISSICKGLAAGGVVACPVCGGEMRAGGTPSEVAVARCTDCRSVLT